QCAGKRDALSFRKRFLTPSWRVIAKRNSEMVGDDLRVVAANRQVCPTISEITFGNLYMCWNRRGHKIWPRRAGFLRSGSAGRNSPADQPPTWNSDRYISPGELRIHPRPRANSNAASALRGTRHR